MDEVFGTHNVEDVVPGRGTDHLKVERHDAGVNRRDTIMPNYSTGGFWYYLRQVDSVDYVVIDAKNYESTIGKQQVLQLANYLSRQSTGLLGITLTRIGNDDTAQYAAVSNG